MKIEVDPAKDAANKIKHGVSLARAADLKVLAAIYDERFTGEVRFRAYGVIDGLPTVSPTLCGATSFARSACGALTRRR